MNHLFKGYSQVEGMPVTEEVGFLHVRETRDGNFYVAEREDPERCYERRSGDLCSKDEALIALARILDGRRIEARHAHAELKAVIRRLMEAA